MDNNKLDQQINNVRSRLSIDYIDVSYGEIIHMYKQDELIVRPEYQRFFRWDSMQQTSFIESLLLGIPIPPVFVAEDKNGIWELVDGFQRISTIISFFGALKEDLTASDSVNHSSDDDMKEKLVNINKWTLDAGTLVTELEGYNIDTLPKKYIIDLKRAMCRVEILHGEYNAAMKYELFQRLNGPRRTPSNEKLRTKDVVNPHFFIT